MNFQEIPHSLGREIRFFLNKLKGFYKLKKNFKKSSKSTLLHINLFIFCNLLFIFKYFPLYGICTGYVWDIYGASMELSRLKIFDIIDFRF